MHRLRFGEMNLMELRVIFGLWDVYCMKLVLRGLLLLLMIWKDCLIRFRKEDMKEFHIGCLFIYCFFIYIKKIMIFIILIYVFIYFYKIQDIQMN